MAQDTAVQRLEEVRAFDATARDTLLAVVSKSEGNYWSLNLDGEFEGRFDEPMLDARGERIPVAQRPAQPHFRPNPFSKYGPTPGHVGLSFGFIQFTHVESGKSGGFCPESLAGGARR